jgi:hypothetical protein
MAIQNFKNIVDSKAYRIDAKDREIFETGDLQSFFGLSDSDSIEFIIYDANDNQLPQSNYGVARYIPLTTQNIRDYFLIADGTLFQALNFPNEYFIDVERLLKEAGYNNGIFKTQITLISNRIGSNSKYDKLWISEISPSRTEIRLLPLKRKETENTDLFQRFGVMVYDGEFRDDTIYYALEFIEKINPIQISTYIKEKYSENWFNKLNAEFKITGFEIFASTVHNKFMQSALYEFTNRISDIRNLEYGSPKPIKPPLQLSKNTIQDTCYKLLIKAIDFYLSTPTFSENSTYDTQTDDSLDIVGQVLQRTESDTKIDTTEPVIKKAEIVKINNVELDALLEKEIAIPDDNEPEPTPEPINPTPGGGGSGGGGGGGGYIPIGDPNDGGLGRPNLGDGGMGRVEEVK